LQIDQSTQAQFPKRKAKSETPKWCAIKQSNQTTTTTQFLFFYLKKKKNSLSLFSEQTIGKRKVLQLLECITN